MENFGKFMLVLIFMVVGTFLGAYVVTKLWGWFVVGAFGVPQISMATAIGLSILISLFSLKYKEESDDFETLTKKFIFAITGKLVALLFGWVVYLFV